MTPESMLNKVVSDYIRGLITPAEFFREAANAVSEIEYRRSDERL